MTKILLLFLFTATAFQAQNIENKEAFKKCRKEFSKKICLTDEDQDNVLFYLDKCSKEKGPIENNGCPWPDSDKDEIPDKDDRCPEIEGPAENTGCPWPDHDGDGIPDKDDACPETPGLPEHNGCPLPPDRDCTKFYEQQRIKYEQFMAEHQNIEQIYTLINKKILSDALNFHKKEMLSNDYGITIRYIRFSSVCGASGCTDFYPEQVNNFLTSKFWTKDFFEYIVKKYNKEILIRRMHFAEDFNPESEKLMGRETFQYLLKYYNEENSTVIIPSKHQKKPKDYIPLFIQFITPYKIEILVPENHKIYEYKNGQWESYIKQKP